MSWKFVNIWDICLPTIEIDLSKHPNRRFKIIYGDPETMRDYNKIEVYGDSLGSNSYKGVSGTEVRNQDIIIEKFYPKLNMVSMVPTKSMDGAIAPRDSFCVLRADPKKVLPRFLFYWARSPEFVNILIAKSDNPADPYVSDKILKSIPIPIPPLAEQHRIVEILDEADHLRKLRYEADVRADAIMPSLYNKFFGDHETNSNNWEQRFLGDMELITIKKGKTPSKNNPAYWNGTIPWVTVKDMDSTLIEDTQYYISEEALREYAMDVVPEGAVLILARPRYVISIAIAGRDVSLSKDVMALIPKNSVRLDPIYLYTFLLSKYQMLNNCVEEDESGTGISRLNTKKFGDIKIMLPPTKLQHKFVSAFRTVPKLHGYSKTCTQQIETLFKTLLYYSFRGQLRSFRREGNMRESLTEMEKKLNV
ncbi:MAG: restriction endonuclease subunit S [Deltaproteobacteria bacterium]|nr:restriction endonuclease subunit S [Deltaproteobacteria bacterium]